MHSLPSMSATPILRRIAAVVSARRYAIACACVLVVAGGLRFYDLGASSLWHDEAIAAVNSRGTFSETVINAASRYSNTSPALYPMMLWAAQKVGSAEFSVRLLPAAASLLTVGVLLLMPRVGVPRGAALLAGLLAALSAAGIEHARDAREYSVDALAAALIVAGTLQYLRNGGKWLLCGALFAGPLLQYGLVMFGAAALVAAALAPVGPPRRRGWQGFGAFFGTYWRRLRGRLDLLVALACFAAGCALTWQLTAQYQLKAGGWGSASYLADFYFQGIGYYVAYLGFFYGRTWDLLTYLMPAVIAVAGAASFFALIARRRFAGLTGLLLFGLIAAAVAAIQGAYPYGGSRHNLYLGPIVFLGAGMGFHTVAIFARAAARDYARSIFRRGWVAPGLFVVAAVGIAVLGAGAIRQADLYRVEDNVARVMAAVDAGMREGDAVYVSRWTVPVFEFYKGGRPADYFYGKKVCWGPTSANWAECVPEVLDEMFRAANNYRRIWFVHNTSASIPREMAEIYPEIEAEVVDVGGGGALRDRKIDVWAWPQATLQLVTGFELLAEEIRWGWLDMLDVAASGAPSAAGYYDLYLRDDALYYARQPCAAADVEARFFLHIYPVDVNDLPDYRRGHGFDNLDFDFQDYGVAAGDRCMIRRELPGYEVERVHAGQFVAPNGAHVWEVEFLADPFEP